MFDIRLSSWVRDWLAFSLCISISPIIFAQDVVSTDILVDNIPNSSIEDQVIAQFTGANSVATITDLGLPSQVDIAALHYIDETTFIFALKSKVQLGPITANSGDILQWQDGVIEIVVSGAELGLGPATRVDALTMNGDALIFSTDIADLVNGLSIGDSDLLMWSENEDTRVLLDQTSCGIPHEADLSGVHLMNTGTFLMTFSSASVIAGIPFRKGDIVSCDADKGIVTPYRRFSELGNKWAAVTLDAISRSVVERFFKDGFENQTNN